MNKVMGEPIMFMVEVINITCYTFVKIPEHIEGKFCEKIILE